LRQIQRNKSYVPFDKWGDGVGVLEIVDIDGVLSFTAAGVSACTIAPENSKKIEATIY